MEVLNFKYGESLLKQKLEAASYVVTDVSRSPEYWEKDIDFLVFNPRTVNLATVEVKWDTKISSTNNLYCEYRNINSNGGKGWLAFSQADFIAYGDAAAQVFHFFSLNELKQYISNNQVKKTSCGSDSEGFLVPLAAVTQFGSYRRIN